MSDDGIKFQWGDRYINAYEVVEGLGGKYWKYDENGKIVIFTVPEHVFNGFISWMVNDPNGTPIKSMKDMKINHKKHSIRFKDIKSFNYAIKEAGNKIWTTLYKPELTLIKVDEKKLTLYLDIENKVYES